MQALDLTGCLASIPENCMKENFGQVIRDRAARRFRIQADIVGVRKVNRADSATVKGTNRNKVVRSTLPFPGLVSPSWAKKIKLRIG